LPGFVHVVGEVVCPRCGRPGRLARHRVRSKGRTYVYAVVKHVEQGRVRRCILGRAEEGGAASARSESLSYEDVLEALAELYQRARERAASGDLSGLEEFVAWVERRLSPLLTRWYEEARLLLKGNDLYR
jgi:hypothetical protein